MIYHSYENPTNKIMVLLLAVFLATSLGWNIKQLFDITNYKRLLTETALLVENAIAYNPVTTIGTAILNAANFDIATPTQTQDAKTIQLKEVKKVDLQCLTENIYFEAGNQSLAGKVAVGQVTLNRMNRFGYPKTVCGVINHKIGDTCMFSWKCAPPQPINTNSAAWKQSHQVAYELLSKDRKDILDITEGATHFHNNSVRPGWKMRQVARIGDHTFYRQ
jgi:spore germination cell wall hydrolase CwlJ-like protein